MAGQVRGPLLIAGVMSGSARVGRVVNMRWCRLLAVGVVMVLGCVSSRPAAVYEPTRDEAVYSYYRIGVPYAQVDCGCADLTVNMQPITIARTQYMRTYLKFGNRTETPHLLHPLQDLTLSASGEGDTLGPRAPTSPSVILASIQNAGAAALVLQAFAGAVDAATVRPTTVSNRRGVVAVVDDTDAKAQASVDRTSRRMESIRRNTDAANASVDASVLRRNTVFGDDTVEGFLYFAVPLGWSFDQDVEKQRSYQLAVRTACGVHTVLFRASPGE
jgi:hypothetical protein